MRTLTRWHPLREVARFDPFADTGFWKEFPATTGAMPEPEPMMRMDVTQNESGYVVKAELPGVAKEDIAVSVDAGEVSISAEVKREKETKEGDKVLRTERYYGSVARAFTLPTDVDAARAEAKFDQGVLTLTLPKAEGARSKTLPVQ
jgi:HSP20 family protein